MTAASQYSGDDMTATGTVCGSCGTEPLTELKVLPRLRRGRCRARHRAEYKQVTVLFADVVIRWTSRRGGYGAVARHRDRAGGALGGGAAAATAGTHR